MSYFVDKKNYLMLCELHNPAIHGKDENSDPHIENHYLVYDRFEPDTGISYLSLDEDYNTDEENDSDSDDQDNQNHITKLQDELLFLQEKYSNPYLQEIFTYHPTIRNYRNIISNSHYIKAEIGQYILLPTQEAIAILKTFWLKIIQRKWKNVFIERQRVKTERRHCASLSFRQMYGKWPETCNYLPSLYGMLNNL